MIFRKMVSGWNGLVNGFNGFILNGLSVNGLNGYKNAESSGHGEPVQGEPVVGGDDLEIRKSRIGAT